MRSRSDKNMSPVFQRTSHCFAACLLVLALVQPAGAVLGAGSAGQGPPDQPKVKSKPSLSPQGNRTSIKAVLNDPAKFRASELTLEGMFRGWKASCASSAMITRSDWVIEDGTGCIYVSGSAPSGLSPAKPDNVRIVVSGKVVTGPKGKPAIRAVRVIRIPN